MANFKRIANNVNTSGKTSEQAARAAYETALSEHESGMPRTESGFLDRFGLKVYHVYHAVKPDFMDNSQEKLSHFPFAPPPGNVERAWEHVADVSCGDVGRVFQLTNHIDEPWQQNLGVVWARSDRERSTSVGDVIVCGTLHGGAKWSVDSVGLRRF